MTRTLSFFLWLPKFNAYLEKNATSKTLVWNKTLFTFLSPSLECHECVWLWKRSIGCVICGQFSPITFYPFQIVFYLHSQTSFSIFTNSSGCVNLRSALWIPLKSPAVTEKRLVPVCSGWYLIPKLQAALLFNSGTQSCKGFPFIRIQRTSWHAAKE